MKASTGKYESTVKLWTIVLLLGALLFGCKKTPDDPDTSGTRQISIESMVFSPSTVTITAGTTVKWTNNDKVPHTVTSSSGLFDSGSLGSGGTYIRKFDTAGSFPYHCALHASMVGNIIVN